MSQPLPDAGTSTAQHTPHRLITASTFNIYNGPEARLVGSSFGEEDAALAST